MSNSIRFGVTMLVSGPLKHWQRCVKGAHVAGGECGHCGGVVIDGSCYVRSDKYAGKRWGIIAREITQQSGGGIRYEMVLIK